MIELNWIWQKKMEIEKKKNFTVILYPLLFVDWAIGMAETLTDYDFPPDITDCENECESDFSHMSQLACAY